MGLTRKIKPFNPTKLAKNGEESNDAALPFAEESHLFFDCKGVF